MSMLRTRWAAVGAAVAITLGAGGLAGVNAAISDGERTVFVPITPCRIVDTRPEFLVGPKSSPLGPGETYTISAHGTNGRCTIPADAVGLALNVTAVGATLPTFLTVWATGAPKPDSSNLNPSPGAPPTPNAVTTDLSAAGQFNIYNLQGNVHVLADVNGYYVDHTHDDRYYTKAQIDAGTALLISGLASPDIHRFTYTGLSSRALATTSSPVKLRDLGTFTAHGVPVKVTWSSAIAGAGVACNFQIRIDGQASGPLNAAGLVGTEATINGTISGVPATIVDTFGPLTPGVHTVELWYRSVASSCDENVGNYTRLVIVEEYGLPA